MSELGKTTGILAGGLVALYLAGLAGNALVSMAAVQSAGEPTARREFKVKGTPQLVDGIYYVTCFIPIQKPSMSHNDMIAVNNFASESDPLEVCLSLADGDRFYSSNYEKSIIGENSFTAYEIFNRSEY